MFYAEGYSAVIAFKCPTAKPYIITAIEAFFFFFSQFVYRIGGGELYKHAKVINQNVKHKRMLSNCSFNVFKDRFKINLKYISYQL